VAGNIMSGWALMSVEMFLVWHIYMMGGQSR